MTNPEFSDTFDTLLNAYNNQALFGEQSSRADITLDEYEKSVLLTQAQDNIVKQYFERTSANLGFDDSERRQADFSSLIKTASLQPVASEYVPFDDRGVLFRLPLKKGKDGKDTKNTDVLFVLNERLIVGNSTYTIVPINYKEYDREMSRAYSQPLKKQAWRLFQNISTGFDIYSEIIPKHNVGKDNDNVVVVPTEDYIYKIRYVRRPNPIVLETLPDGLSIDGTSEETPCELNPILHSDILNEAIRIAVSTRGVRPQQQKSDNNNS